MTKRGDDYLHTLLIQGCQGRGDAVPTNATIRSRIGWCS
jgi:hypothetical protein